MQTATVDDLERPPLGRRVTVDIREQLRGCISTQGQRGLDKSSAVAEMGDRLATIHQRYKTQTTVR